jgi:phosphoribosyl-AMP cyclohydrolase
MICENPPDFAKRGGLLTAIAQDHESGEILMVAYMNEASFRRTLELGQAVYWSTSRGELWHKGGTSGNVQIVKELRVDCDGDAILLCVEQKGAGACHTGRRSCFFRRFEDGRWVDAGDAGAEPLRPGAA